ncbi:MAG: hypothetical protein OXG08_11230 [Gammaproteobacteria bacterium]|nr:hypothetical protein [Gammaproteobacteria bacterium]
MTSVNASRPPSDSYRIEIVLAYMEKYLWNRELWLSSPLLEEFCPRGRAILAERT